MRIANRKRFTLSCIFFTLLMLIIGKNQIVFSEGKVFKVTSSPEAKELGKNDNAVLKNKKRYIVILDAGHGGIDEGTSYQNINEKDIAFKITKYTETVLESKGYTVILTRNEDKLLSLKEIGNIVNAAKGNVFVSIHINSIKDPSYKGMTTYYYAPEGYQKDERVKLSKTIQKEVVKSDGWEDKGIKTQNLAVLRYSEIPCALVECGFITNKEDREKLLKEEVLRNISENISRGIIKYLNESEGN